MSVKFFSKQAEQTLLNYKWPGNIRELISVCERAAILSQTDEIEKDELFIDERDSVKNISDMEKELIIEALEECDYDTQKASKLISMTKSSFLKKIEKYKIKV
jgi:two-component system NtrC family response regulator